MGIIVSLHQLDARGGAQGGGDGRQDGNDEVQNFLYAFFFYFMIYDVWHRDAAYSTAVPKNN